MRLAEWLLERGIGEERALLVANDRVLAARHHLAGTPKAGALYPAKLVSRSAGSSRGTALADAGFEVLLDKLPRDCTEGSTILVELTRAPIAERGRLKRAQGRIAAAYAQASEREPMRELRAFPAGLWEEVWHAASAGSIAFPGGEILCSVTPAMTVIDIDGDLRGKALALAAIPAIAQALRWFAIGGSIGIDFPTLQTKAERAEVDHALAVALDDWPHERTAMNGFGFVQIVARLEGPSLLHRFALSRTGMCARCALRVAEQASGQGATLLLRVHPALKPKLKEDWLAELARRTGKQVRIETDPALALEAPHAQLVTL